MSIVLKKKTKLYALTPSSGKYGAEKSLVNFTNKFRILYENDIEIIPLTTSKNDLLTDENLIFSSRRVNSLRFILDFINFLKILSKDDVLILWTTLPAILLWPCSFIVGCQIIVSERDSLNNPHTRFIRFLRVITYRICKRRVHFLFNSLENLKAYKHRWNLLHTHIVFNEIQILNSPIVVGENLNQCNFKVALIGRICEQKGTLMSLMILESLINSKVQIEVSIYGDFTSSFYEKSIREYVSSSVLDVHFFGYESISDILAAGFDFVLSMSQHEGFPNLLLDCISKNQVIFCNDCSTGPSEILGENSSFLIQYNDINDAILRLSLFMENKKIYLQEFAVLRNKTLLEYGYSNYVLSIKKLFRYDQATAR